MKIALFTTETLHHIFYAKCLSQYCSELVIFNEVNKDIFNYQKNNFINKNENLEFHQKQYLYEKKLWFGEKQLLLDDIAQTFAFDSLSSQEAILQISNFQFDIGLVYGTSRLSIDFINSFVGPLYNFHGGDTELYRGLDSHLWALYHKDRNGLILTMHLVDEILDNGDIIFKTTLPISKDSELYKLRSITTYECINLTKIIINCFENSIKLPRKPQRKTGRYYSSIPKELILKCESNFLKMYC